MFEIRIHGRGGQGVVTAAELLSVAAFYDGLKALAFPSFGSERMGAPVTAFCRLANQPIRSREPVSQPDAVIIQDSTLLSHVDVFHGLSENGYVLINSTRSLEELQLAEFCARLPEGHARTVSVFEIAGKYLQHPHVNTGLVAALSALTQVVQFDSVKRAIAEKFPGHIGDVNVKAATDVYQTVTSSLSCV